MAVETAAMINPADSLERQNEKLHSIVAALVNRVEFGAEEDRASYAQFERAALLEERVRMRTLELEHTLDLLHESNRQVSEAHRETEEARRNLSDAIETVTEGFALFDAEDRLVMCNTRFCRDFTDTVTDLTPGLPFADYVQQVSQSRHLHLPENTTPTDWARGRLRRHNDERAFFNVQMSHDRWMQVSEHRTATGGTVILQTHVTDLVRLERRELRQLRNKQSRMIRATLDHLNQGVCIFDSSARLIGWNTRFAALLALPAHKMQLGASFESLIDRVEDGLHFARGMTRIGFLRWARRASPRDPISFEAARGSQTLAVFGRGIPDHGFVISITDVTAERETAKKLFEINEVLEQRVLERTLELEDALTAAERANATKSRFVAAASHDLLQPLSAAKLFIGSLAESVTSDADTVVLSKAEEALNSAEQMIEALLDISKLEGDKLRMDVRPVALRDVFDPLRSEMEILAREKGLTLRIVDSSLTVASDPAYLRRILQNLLSNAIRYTRSGSVLLGARRHGGSARIEVWDTGSGIAEEDQSSIFEEFRRLDTKASRNDGLGLGLAIVERACARLGHPLGLWSEPGLGSCFMVNAPIVGQDQPVPQPIQRAFSPSNFSFPGMIVVLVLPDGQLRRAISALMESWGISVLEAEASDDALTLLEDLQIAPDAVLIDHHLDLHETGLDFCRRLRAAGMESACALLSSDRSTAVRRGCKTAGAAFIVKPVDRQKLGTFLETVAQSLEFGP